MITEIRGKNVKGQEFTQSLEVRNIFIGPNGSGKSVRSQALQLAVLGYVPSNEKTNPAILRDFGSNGKLAVGVTVNGTRLDRVWKQTPKSATQVFLLDRHKCKKDEYISALAQSQPKIFEISAFTDLSDQKKIDFIFNLFPPNINGTEIDVNQIQEEIEVKNDSKNKLQAGINELKNLIKRLASQKYEIDLPAGTLAEAQAKYDKAESDLNAARSRLIKINEEIRAKQEADAAAQKRLKEAQKNFEEEAAKTKAHFEKQVEELKSRQPEKVKPAFQEPKYSKPDLHEFEGVNAWQEAGIGSIKRIIDAIKHVNCPGCSNGFPFITAAKELKKWQPK